MNLVFITTLVLFSTLSSVNAGDVTYTNSTSMDEGRYNLWWKYESSADTFYFKVEVEAKGWISFGFTQLESISWMRNAMYQYDVLVAGVYSANGSTYGLDYLTLFQNKSQYPDHADDVNDWKITSGYELDNKTILEFNRKRTTSDPINRDMPSKGDINITPGLRFFAWAYHKTIDTPYLNSISLIHDRSGLEKVMLMPLEDKKPVHITFTPKTTGGSTTVSSLATVFIILFLLIIC